MFIPIAQSAAEQVVFLLTAREFKNIIINNTDADPDSITLKVVSMVVGEIVSKKAKPYTDDAVEKVAAWIASKRNKKTAEK